MCCFLLHLLASPASPRDTTLSWLLTHPIIEFSFLAYPDLPYHIIHGESLFTFANLLSHHPPSSSYLFLLFSLFFFFDIKLAIVHVLSALYGHRCRWNIEILRTCISFLSPLSVTLSKTRSLNGSQVLMTCRASSWSWIYGPIFHGENWNCGFQCRPQPMTGFTPRNVRITFASLFVCDVTFARYRRILATRRGWKFEAEFLALKPLWYCSYEGERWMHTFGLSSLVIVLL